MCLINSEKVASGDVLGFVLSQTSMYISIIASLRLVIIIYLSFICSVN